MQHNKNNVPLHDTLGLLGQSLLNNTIGEYLEREQNPLAVKMGYYHHFQRLSLDNFLPYQIDFPLSNKVTIFVHGLTDMESIWKYAPSNDQRVCDYIDTHFEAHKSTDNDNYGRRLQQEFGFTPFYLRYNTGLSTQKNARKFVQQISRLFAVYPIEIDDVMLVGFGMGGTLVKYAHSLATQNQYPWLSALSKCVYLGTTEIQSSTQQLGHIGGEVVRAIPSRHAYEWATWLERKSAKLALNVQVSQSNPASLERRDVFCDAARHYFVYGENMPHPSPLLNAPESPSLNGSQLPSIFSHCVGARFGDLSHTPLAHSSRVYRQLAIWVRQDARRERIPVIHFMPAERPYLTPIPIHRSIGATFLAGTIDLVASACDKSLEAVEMLHFAIAEGPFYALQKVPVASQFAHPIERAHRKLLNIAYRSMRDGCKWIHRFAETL